MKYNCSYNCRHSISYKMMRTTRRLVQFLEIVFLVILLFLVSYCILYGKMSLYIFLILPHSINLYLPTLYIINYCKTAKYSWWYRFLIVFCIKSKYYVNRICLFTTNRSFVRFQLYVNKTAN